MTMQAPQGCTISPLKVIRAAHYETDYLALFISVAETSGSSFSFRSEFSGKTHSQPSKGELISDAC